MEIAGMSVLIVDDEEALREIFVEEFTARGAKVESAENGRKAFELLKTKKFDVLLSDVRMPGADGIELVKNIQSKLDYKPHIFLCTGYAELNAEDLKKWGVTEIFSKPTSLSTIFDKLKSTN